MNQLQRLQRRFENLIIYRRNRRFPFEFGPVTSRDRFRLSSKLKLIVEEEKELSLGMPIEDGEFNFPVEMLDGGKPPAAKAAAASFRVVQSMFESLRVEKKLHPWKILGFMTDGPTANGLAFQLHEEDVTRFGIVITAGSFFESCLSAFHVAAFPGFCPEVKHSGILYARCNLLFPDVKLEIPKSVERRNLAIRLATWSIQATFFHELAHVLRGHIGYWDKVKKEKKYHEKNEAASDGLIEDIRRAIETDADDFAGRFMAKIIQKKIGEVEYTLDNRILKNMIFEVVVGVTLMYALFGGDESYHDGTLRALILLSSMCTELRLPQKETAEWLFVRIQALGALMRQRGILRGNLGAIETTELSRLLNDTLKRRERLQHIWLKSRPSSW